MNHEHKNHKNHNNNIFRNVQSYSVILISKYSIPCYCTVLLNVYIYIYVYIYTYIYIYVLILTVCRLL